MKILAASTPIRTACDSTWATIRWTTPSAQAKLVAESWPKIVDGLTEKGDGYQKARRAFNMLLARHGEAMFLSSRSSAVCM